MSTLMDFDYLVKKEHIDLSFNGLHDGNIDILVEVLEKSTVLKELNLYSNRILPSPTPRSQLRSLMHWLQTVASKLSAWAAMKFAVKAVRC